MAVPMSNLWVLSFFTLWLMLGSCIATHATATGKPTPYRPNYHTSYHDYQRFVSDLLALKQPSSAFGSFVTVETASQRKSVQGRDLYVLSVGQQKKVDAYRENTFNQTLSVFLTFGEHPRELIVLEVFFKLMEFLETWYDRGCDTTMGRRVRFLLSHCRFTILPLVNPDGKVLLEKQKDWCFRHNANGVDLNRNFDWMFGGPASSSVRGEEEYRGTEPFSEPESSLVRDIAANNDFDLYLSLHSGEQQIFLPFVDSFSRRSKRRYPYMKDGLDIIDRMCASSNGYFVRSRSGVGYEKNSYSADGTVYDYMAGRTHIPLSMCIELYGGPQVEDCFEQFNPPNERVTEVCDTVVTSLVEGIWAALEKKGLVPPTTTSGDTLPCL